MKKKNKSPQSVQEIFAMSETLNLSEEERLYWIADEASKLADKGDKDANELMTELFKNIISEAEKNPDVPEEELRFMKAILTAGEEAEKEN